jgi:hypothetical protein
MKLNKKGVIGLPLRLAMAFLILSLSVPTVLYMVEDLKDDSNVSILHHEASKLSDALSQAYYSGEGGGCTVEVSVKMDSRLTIGGEGKNAYSIGIFINDTEKERIFLQRPSVKIFGDPLDISGNRTLYCKGVIHDGVYGVEVTAVA